MQHIQPMKPLILVSNDDSYSAKGVHELIRSLQEIGEVVCVCPELPQSGMSMALTVNSSLRLHRLDDYHGTAMYKVSGTPVDCIKIAVDNLLPRKPDIVVTGINHGSNAAINVVYSGTMGAAFEGCAYGIPSVGFSLTDHSEDADFEPCLPVVKSIVKNVLAHGLPQGICLNVNMPAHVKEYKGIRVVKGCRGRWDDSYVEYRDPAKRPFYWLAGTFVNEEPENEATDEWCLANGFVSVVPVKLDPTYDRLNEFAWLNQE